MQKHSSCLRVCGHHQQLPFSLYFQEGLWKTCLVLGTSVTFNPSLVFLTLKRGRNRERRGKRGKGWTGEGESKRERQCLLFPIITFKYKLPTLSVISKKCQTAFPKIPWQYLCLPSGEGELCSFGDIALH